jgi:hypothetical protein
MAKGSEALKVACPGCGGMISIDEVARQESVTCPDCGGEWRLRLQDVPGSRFLIDLGPPDA